MQTRGRAQVLAAFLLLASSGHAFERTEEREPCADRSPLRNLYFGDTHVHTAFSFDASALGVRATPRDAYRFARGDEVGVRPYGPDGVPLRRAQLERPLDFAVVTDHAGLLGEVQICRSPGLPGYDSVICRVVRRWPLLAYYFVSSRAFNIADPSRYRFCGHDGAGCRDAAAVPWERIQQAAEEAYDRTSDCSFSTFVGYEWTGGPEARMIHRNVVFRNAVVPAAPVSYFEESVPEGLWRRLRSECLDREDGCDVLAIPHNSNLSAGALFQVETADGQPIGREDALRRAALEPLVEIMQHKGDSECRVAGAAEDELCGFEKLPFARMDQQRFSFLWEAPPRMAFVRDVLAQGLVEEERLGVNPFKLGIIASTDTHIGAPGLVAEEGFPGHAAGGDTARTEIPRMPDAIDFNPGGLAAVWAEENSRDSLFEAMRRREVYGTSGPRISVRFFGGWGFDEDLCDRPDFVQRGYRGGVPMGSDLAPWPGDGSAPALAIWALKDPGTAKHEGTPLQRVQVVKAWVEEGRPRQRVYEVAGNPNNGAGVDPATCELHGSGFDGLCAVWRDPSFDPAQRALYYIRVVENPSCRWSAYVCNAQGVDCSRPGSVPSDLRPCCDPRYPRTIQERAWTSPIWYAPAS